MSVRNPRTRLISFRLSESEYRALQTLCEAKEARSLSDFVRTTVRWMVDNEDPSNSGKSDVLDREIRRLKLLLTKP